LTFNESEVTDPKPLFLTEFFSQALGPFPFLLLNHVIGKEIGVDLELKIL
jgi:hypothetical protein